MSPVFGWPGGAASLAIPPLSPATLGPSFWLYSGDTAGAPSELTIVAGDVTVAGDHGGGTLTLTGHTIAWGTSSPPPVNARGKQRAYLDLDKSRGSYMTGASLFGGHVSPAAYIAPWTMMLSCCFTADPTHGTSSYDGIMLVGSTDRAADKASYAIGCSTAGTHGTIQGLAQVCAPTITAPFGSETLQAGTSGYTCPSYQVPTVVHAIDPVDGLWYVTLYIDGVVAGKALANAAGAAAGSGIALDSDGFGLLSVYFAYLPPRTQVFDAVWYPRALTETQVRGVTAYLLAEVSAPATCTKVVLCAASIGLGYEASPLSDGWATLLPTTYAAAYPAAQPLLLANESINGWSAVQWQTLVPTSWPTVTAQFSVRAGAGKKICFISDLPINDTGQAHTVAQAMVCMRALVARAFAAGFDRVVVSALTPYDNSLGSSWLTLAAAMQADMLAEQWVGNVTHLNPSDITDTTAVPGYPGNGAPAATVGGLVAILVADPKTSGVHPGNAGHAALAWINAIKGIGPL